LQLAQLDDIGLREEIRARAENLAQLDKSGTELLKGKPESLRYPKTLCAAGTAPRTPKGQVTRQARSFYDKTQSVTEQDLGNLAGPRNLGPGLANAERRWHGAAHFQADASITHSPSGSKGSGG